ncbi:MAG: hypothetical protein NW201_01210 [Gemmatimonadales bacterium]|nr:hypothetical protein [Gemmatimonadales bacterium]
MSQSPDAPKPDGQAPPPQPFVVRESAAPPYGAHTVTSVTLAEFTANGAALAAQVSATGIPLVVMLEGAVLVTVLPGNALPPKPLWGVLKGRITSVGDIVSPIGEAWHAEQDGPDA